MEALTVKVVGINTSFRRILDFNYQRTYTLPPPTTIIGFLGAALGYSDRELWSGKTIIDKLNFSVLALNVPGFGKDMWTLQKIKNNKIAGSSPYLRELLFYPEYLMVFSGDEDILENVESHLKDPVYALSLGRDDELVRIAGIEWKELDAGEPVFTGTILPFDIREFDYRPELEEGIFVEPPIIEKLPVRFTINKKGVRSPDAKKSYSFIPNSFKVRIKNSPTEIFSVDGRNFTWLK